MEQPSKYRHAVPLKPLPGTRALIAVSVPVLVPLHRESLGSDLEGPDRSGGGS